MKSVTVVGVGRLGGALALALSRGGYSVRALVHPGRSNVADIAAGIEVAPLVLPTFDAAAAASDIVLLTTPDPAIGAAAGEIRAFIRKGTVVLHTSGSLSSDVLAPLAGSNASLGSFHPLISVADPIAGADLFSGAYFCVEGDDGAVDNGREMARKLGGKSFAVAAADKALYHAAAVMTAGHVVALVDTAMGVLGECGLSLDEAKEVLMPLLRSTAENLSRSSPAEALTGSFARGDLDAVGRHIQAFREHSLIEELEIYKLIGLRSAEIAERAGGDREVIEAIRSRIMMA
jgi:predicted short-subunit dehydrogenase-like oxidoreductase (DUF2520 family)